ncbi:phosphotransferase [Nocardioides sp.]|uniref:phosphotransferase n=1 Tax=Nocardioides sp. TaxID=35761 RepID=UPI003783079B
MTTAPDPRVVRAPPAASGGSRVQWSQIPDVVRAAIESQFGSTVISAQSQPGGFSPGSADRVVLADGRRAFVKAVGAEVNPDTPAIHRREIAVTTSLPDAGFAPRLLGAYDDGQWVALAFEDVDGRSPQMPWRTEDLTRCLIALGEMAVLLSPSPLPDLPRLVDAVADDFTRWDALAADVPTDLDPWAVDRLPELADLGRNSLEAMDGVALVHGDIRADNLLLTDEGVVVVDWPWASLGAPWVDSLTLVLNAAVFGEHDPEAQLNSSPGLVAADPDAMTATVAGLAGYFSWQGRQPARPEMPTIRRFQLAQADACLRWLRVRLDGASW